MEYAKLIYALDLFGTVVFALSGVLVAARKNMDFVGVVTLASVVAIGGGTIRDLILRVDVIFWVADNTYIYAILGTCVVGSFWISQVDKLDRRLLPIFDALGLAVFVGIGFNKALTYGTSYLIALILGTLTGVGGGVIRDTLADDVPFIFRREIYATACVIGAMMITLLLLLHVPHTYAIVMGMLTTLVVRLWAIKNAMGLPQIKL